MEASTEESYLWVRIYFTSSAQYVLFVLFGWFQRWEVGGLKAVVFLWCCIQDLFKIAHSILVLLHLAFSKLFVRVQVEQIYKGTDSFTVRIPVFILSESSDYHVVDNLSIAVHALPMHMLTSLLVDEILSPSYINWSTYFRSLPINVEMARSCLKQVKFILFWFM